MKKENLGVSIVIPNYNGVELLRIGIPKVVKAWGNAKNNIKELIVVDDNSYDGSVNFLKNNFPDIRVIKHKKNRGFSYSVNTGARSTKHELICLLNNDVLPEVNFLVKVARHFDDEKVFAVSLHEKGFGWAKGRFKDGFIIHQGVKEDEKVHETFWVNGGSGVFRRSYWMKLRGMDEKLLTPFYWEDVDLSYRAAKRGYINLWEPASRVVHEHESTIGKIKKRKRQTIQERNHLLFIWKNLTSPNLFRKHLLGLLNRISKHPGYLRIVFMALMRLRGVIKARNVEKRESKVSDETIFAKYN